MPNYFKSMKEIKSNKKKLDTTGTISISENCSDVIQRKYTKKLKDPGSFTIPYMMSEHTFSRDLCDLGAIPYMISEHTFNRDLCDLGASINLMHWSVLKKKLKLGELRPTNLSLQMVDHLLTYSKGIVEDVLVKVGTLIFLTDFIDLEMKEDKKVPLNLRRPCLATTQALINIKS